jgi:hypothetical protein
MSARTIPQVALRVVVDDYVDVAAQTVRVDGRQIPPALQ